MNPLRSISESYKRWRHSHGFGIHSPFAYELVKNVVTPGRYGYYGYRDIDAAILSPGTEVGPHTRHDARLLLRLLVFLESRRLLIYPREQPLMECAAKAAGVKCTALTKNMADGERDMSGTLMLVDYTTPFLDQIHGLIESGVGIIATDPKAALRTTIKSAMKNGLILEGKRILIAIPREHMALTEYSMKL